MRVCSIDDCTRTAHARGWCITHYRRWRVHGDVTRGRKTLKLRFEEKVDQNGPIPDFCPDLGPCWIWMASCNAHGYGVVSGSSGAVQTAPSVSYELYVGKIPKGLEIDHLCRVRLCVNPRHLEAVTHKENMARGHWRLKTHCPQGHPYDGDNLYVAARGDRQCKTCRRIRQRKRHD